MVHQIDLIYGFGWLGFGLIHSLLARDGVKSQLKPLLGTAYRLAYNIFAALQVMVLYGIGLWLYGDMGPYLLAGWLSSSLTVLYIAGWILMVLALREYDLGLFSGLKQVRTKMTNDEEPLHFKGFHRFVRHPIYSAAFLILWGRVRDEFSLMTAVFASLYLWIGCFFEERQLIRLYGDQYRFYKSQVPAFIPYKGRVDLGE
ncbi:isoprenylcysteine carboxylmethyltransferase family protein [Terasakiella sp. A23]|uniref:methyltransferase family protein n=1 Tax=Terasakiella sp. FCG-A23 TaxID=3080561 RepID=UPI00295502F5|nr:isoprenylcysteine carboxylmethyltransferase family protein [Terasakiella sp. A23]MDV7339836.1 isoprenylcysteine carboxylmethyltransferase family protein [Terasakiella sp. A23]